MRACKSDGSGLTGRKIGPARRRRALLLLMCTATDLCCTIPTRTSHLLISAVFSAQLLDDCIPCSMSLAVACSPNISYFKKTLHVNPLGFHVWSLSSHQGHPKYQHDDCLLSRPDAYQERPLGRAWNRCNSIRRCLTYSCILPAAEPFLDGSEPAGRDVYSLQVYLKGRTVIQTSPYSVRAAHADASFFMEIYYAEAGVNPLVEKKIDMSCHK